MRVRLELSVFLARMRAQQKRFAEAHDFANRSYRMMQTLFGENSGPAASAPEAVAYVEEQAGELEQAALHYAEALRIMREVDTLESDAALALLAQYADVAAKPA